MKKSLRWVYKAIAPCYIKSMNTTKNSTVYINNLSYERDRNGIKSMFSKFGIIKKIKIVVEPTTNQSRGMAFVEMGTNKEATAAIAGLNLKVVDGRTVKATWATPQKETSKPRFEKEPSDRPEVKKKKIEKDLDFASVQIAKKARNDAKRKANPFIFKMKSKTTTPKTK
jgi:RNA recognition motif-containing protein